MPHNINWEFVSDVYPPIITFSNPNPSSRMVVEGTGSVHVTVIDDGKYGFVQTSGITLVDGSLGEINTSSFNIISDKRIEFDVFNIAKSGYVTVSAIDFYGNSSTATDEKWFVSCNDPLDVAGANNRLINLQNFLPQHLVESEVYDFVGFFQDYLNTLYEKSTCLGTCHISNLKKIERLSTLHDADTIDPDLLDSLAAFMGYDVDVNRFDLGTFRTSATSVEDLEGEQLCSLKLEENKYLRFVVRNLPNWYRIKTTNNAIRVALFSFGIIGQTQTLYTNDYDKLWFPEDRKDNVDIKTEFGEVRNDFYPTPHFKIIVDLRLTLPEWTDSIGKVKDAINSIRPVNTVFDGIGGRYDLDVVKSTAAGGIKVSEHIYIPWDKPSAKL